MATQKEINDTYSNRRFIAAVFLAMIIMLIFLGYADAYDWFRGENSYHDTYVNVHWICGGIAFLVMLKKGTAGADWGTFFCVLLGPITLMIWGFYWLFQKIFPEK